MTIALRAATGSLLVAWLAAVPVAISAGEADLAQGKPVPDMQVLPLPYDQASFQEAGAELTRYHFGPGLKRPFLYPVIGPEGRSLTRMGHPRDPITHSHHNSVWISHQKVQDVNFWEDGTKPQIVCLRIEQYEDEPQQAWLLAVNAWKDAEGKVLMQDRRRIAVQRLGPQQFLILVDLQLEAAGSSPVTLGQTPFGMIGVRMAKTICVNDGGGRILNSEGRINEPQVFRRPAKWVDYSGPVTSQATGGIALMDHPSNPSHPTPFHVRSDGWMGACLTFQRPLTIEPKQPVRLRYGLWVHAGVPKVADVDDRWQAFSKDLLPPLQRTKAIPTYAAPMAEPPSK